MIEGNGDLETRIHPPLLAEDCVQIAAFLASRGLSWDEDPDYCVVMLRDGRIVGSGSLSGRIIKGLAVDEMLVGEGLMVRILSELEAEAGRRGIVRPFIFTSPPNRAIFESLGYRFVGEAPGASVLLEKGDGIGRWCAELRGIAGSAGRAASPAPAAPVDPAGSASSIGPVSALVMNCNPFTLGHLHLVRTAASRSSRVFLFVVAEEASSFPYATRLRLVREGTTEFPNVVVIPGNEYIVSRATFPTYFLKDKAGAAAEIHARLDVDIFGRHIAPAVGATRRFIGEEPYSEVTAIYNRVMKKWLPSYGIEVVEIPRLADYGGAAVSASTVRRLIREGNLENARDIVPPSTWNYLISEEAAPVLERIASSDGRH
jgi:[citrate (pro-3S)-lyase] ligase